MKNLFGKWLLVGVLSLAVGSAACASEPADDEGSDPLAAVEGDATEADEGDVGTSQDALDWTCNNICSVGSVLGCARFGAVGGVACGFGSIVGCAAFCSERQPCGPGYRKVRICGGGRAPRCTFVCRR